MSELLSSSPDVVIAGEVDAPMLIRALFADYGICPKLFASRRLLSPGTFTKYRFVRRVHTKNDYYDLHTLLSLAAPEPRMTVLVPASEEMRELTEKHSELLESKFIIRTQDELADCLPSYNQKRKNEVSSFEKG